MILQGHVLNITMSLDGKITDILHPRISCLKCVTPEISYGMVMAERRHGDLRIASTAWAAGDEKPSTNSYRGQRGYATNIEGGHKTRSIGY